MTAAPAPHVIDREPQEADADLDRLLDAFTRSESPDTVERARALIARVLSLHGDCLQAILTGLRTQPNGPALILELASDPRVSPVLLLHDLHPRPLAERVEQAAKQLGTRLAARGISLELGPWSSEVVEMRLEPITRSEPPARGSALPTRASLEQARVECEQTLLAAAPEVTRVDCHYADPDLIPVARLHRRSPTEPAPGSPPPALRSHRAELPAPVDERGRE